MLLRDGIKLSHGRLRDKIPADIRLDRAVAAAVIRHAGALNSGARAQWPFVFRSRWSVRAVSEDEAFDAFEACWSQWCAWVGVAPLRGVAFRMMRRRE